MTTSNATFAFRSGARVCPAKAGFCPAPLGGRELNAASWPKRQTEAPIASMGINTGIDFEKFTFPLLLSFVW